MKFPSLFRTASPMRYDIKPRYYDPVKEEIEQRTSRIRRELAEQGLLNSENEDSLENFSSGIRGSFSQYRGIKPRETSVFSSTAIIRTLLFLGMILMAFGYIYIGPDIFTYLLYLGLLVAGVYFFFRLKNRSKDE
ncbi:MAG: hypothetical protein Q8S14_06060 [Algoriphagus sp.]|uniref:hypothetical protein n=1 Tax=Algoriphagus sp. TaxID=1872435 RepID=UPI0027278C37|nr:hypothetical protein [Algoriphagus sp.]MDO8965515.1 hypothetical protein [Algoriphagus sp.]MDP2042639.1 hypothetical protein [Algoriphagus sp.]MDP3201555.1 hypothetical protein [Algoriphagus sp.]MDP3471420.1 hypothetical protein [Algoriphagus sp.]